MNCPMCDRPLGGKIEGHHLIPKTFGGKETEDVHRICHQKIHSTFSERDLKNEFFTWDKIRSHEEIEKFVKWVRKKSPEFYIKSDDTGERRAKRR